MKGKVERGVGYLKTSFLEGRSFIDLEDLNRQLAAWLDTVANVRVHGTTRERPVDRHVHELVKLGALIAVPQYDTRALEIRRVAPDSHFSFGGVLYSVFPEAAGKRSLSGSRVSKSELRSPSISASSWSHAIRWPPRAARGSRCPSTQLRSAA